MGGRYLDPDAGLSFGNNRIKETHGIYAFIEQFGRHLLGQFGISQHDGDDWMRSGFGGKTGRCDLLPEIGGVLLQSRSRKAGAFQQLNGFDGRRHNWRGQGI